MTLPPQSPSLFSTTAKKHLSLCVLLPLLLLSGCASTPKNPSTGTDASAESNEPDLLAQLRERMASGTLKHTSKSKLGFAVDAKKDSSQSPAITTADTSKQQAALAVAGDYAKALSLMSAKKDDEALLLLQKIASAAPQFSGPPVNQAIILMKQTKFAEATALLRTALATNPKNPYAFNLLGIALREQGKFPEAKAAYESALALDPNYAKAHFNYGVLADMYIQDLPLALAHYERYQALQSSPDTVVAHWITSLQKRTGTYKAPAPVALPPPEPEPETAESTETAEPSSPPAAASSPPNTAAPAASAPSSSEAKTAPAKTAPAQANGKKS